jgi:hypothetical protein
MQAFAESGLLLILGFTVLPLLYSCPHWSGRSAVWGSARSCWPSFPAVTDLPESIQRGVISIREGVQVSLRR